MTTMGTTNTIGTCWFSAEMDKQSAVNQMAKGTSAI
jgi:hypothetical protein